MQEIVNKLNLYITTSNSSLWLILVIVLLGVVTAYTIVSTSVLGITSLFFTLLLLFFFGLGMEKSLLVLLFLRINLDAFHNQINIPVASYKSLSLPSAIGIFILFFGALHLLFKGSNLWKLRVVKAMALFIVGCLLSLLFSQNLTNSFTELIELFSFVVLFLLIVDFIRSEEDLKKMVNCLLLSSIIPLIVGLLQILNNLYINIGLEPSYRIYSTLTHPNAFAFYMVIISVLALSLLMGAKKFKEKSKYFIHLGFLSFCLIYTFTRSAWLGLSFAVFIVGLLQHRKLLILTPVIIGLMIYNLPLISERFQPLLNPDLQKYTSLAWRINIWNSSFPYFLTHPVFGNGFGNFIFVGYEVDNWYAAAHNDYLRILVETGILGFSGFIWILISLWRTGIKAFKNATNSYHRNISAGFIALLLAYMVMSLSDNIFNHGGIQWYFWGYAGVVTAIYRIDFSKINV
jgi:putative inorganic carbon (HCO3(-)) transporter